MRIFLIGFMGTGKSHWGKIWANALNFSFIDMDEEIEKQEQQSITQIFETNGEDYFREKEAALLRTFIAHQNTIISCGGGCPCFLNNMDWMNTNGLTVFLEATPAYILNNIKNEIEKRPVLKKSNDAEMLFFIEQKLKERLPFYTKAKINLPAASLQTESLQQVLAHSS